MLLPSVGDINRDGVINSFDADLANTYNYIKIEGDTLYWVEYFEVPTENVSRPWEMEAILRSGEIVVLPEDTDYRILLEYSDADIQVFLNIADVNIFEIGALASSYKKLKDILGENAAIDIVGICGYYSLISMTLNVFKVPRDTDKWLLPNVENFNNMLNT